jgi:hypothetical protein
MCPYVYTSGLPKGLTPSIVARTTGVSMTVPNPHTIYLHLTRSLPSRKRYLWSGNVTKRQLTQITELMLRNS